MSRIPPGDTVIERGPGMLDDGTIQPDAGDPDESSETLTRGSPREHAIVLCCAHSVVELVEEVARNLAGLGFEVEVVCGAEARTALLGHGTGGTRPTIYVVCVQGTLKEQVLKPLRQALATHGGPNQHLFAAVLDLALPLAMVGQIRRFAEALGRPRRRKDGLGERRQWREQLGASTERVATRSYRALEVITRDTGSSPAVDAVHRTGPQAVIGSARPAPVGATDKYRAVTGALPTVDAEIDGQADDAADTSGAARRAPRRARAPKIRVKAVPTNKAQARRSTPVPDEPTTARGDTQVAPAPVAEDAPVGRTTVIVTPKPVVPDPAAATPAMVLPMEPASGIVIEPIESAPRSSTGLFAAAAVVLLAVGGAAWWWTSSRASSAGPAVAAAASEAPRAEQAPAAAPTTATAAPKATSAAPPSPAKAAPADVAASGVPAAPTNEPNAVAPAPTTPTSETPAAAPAPTPPIADTPSAGPDAHAAPPPPAPDAATDDAATRDTTDGSEAPTAPPMAELSEAIASRRLRVTDRLYVSTTRSTASSWSTARATCEAYAIDGVGGFRLPHRRELQMLDVVGLVKDGPHWSRTVPDDDTESAYVLHASTGQLVVWSKEDPASVVCVRPR